MSELPATPQLPFAVWVVASVASVAVGASRSIGWLRYILPGGWLLFGVGMALADASLSGLARSHWLWILGGLLPLFGWLRRPAAGYAHRPFPLRETLVALLYPDVYRVISTAAVFCDSDSAHEA